MPKRREHSRTVAIVGAESLLGREVREVLDTAAVDARVQLVAAADENGAILTELEGEAAVMASLQAGDVADATAVILAGSPETARKARESVAAAPHRPVFIDLSRGLEDDPAARLRAPMAESGQPASSSEIYVIAHPAAIALAVFLRRLQAAAPARRTVVQAFEPASERGQKGLDELQQQTVGLLSFQPLRKEVFDTQVSFNMLSAWGEEAPHSLERIESTIDRHLATLLSSGPHVPMPSLRLSHAPVFHGYSFSVWAEFEAPADVRKIADELITAHIDVRRAGEESPSNVGVAGQSGITVGGITPDRNDRRACWFWIAADNFRIAAENAVEVAREVVG